MTKTYKVERWNSTMMEVLSASPRPRRIGFICGARKVYHAERGPRCLGYHKTIKAAAEAIVASYTE